MKHIIFIGLVALALVACGDDPASGPSCTVTGTPCTDGAAECCTGFCDEISGNCGNEPGKCLAADAACSIGTDCCTVACVDFKCSSEQCVSDSQSCDDDGECCSGICTDGSCAPLNAACKTAGNTCGDHAECCSKFCDDADGDGTKTCNSSPSFCTTFGDTCVNDGQCCGGLCTKANGSTYGTCALVPSAGASQCSSMGEVCGAGAAYDPATPLPTCGGECCSRACFPYGATGVLVCQPPSGCRPTGELCMTDNDCCGGGTQPDADKANTMCRKEPGFALGRCDQGNMCAPAGDICRLASTSCNDTDRCCAGTVQQFPEVCRQDNLGIPRCGIGTGIDCTNPEDYVGDTCATSADCCGLPCTGNPEVGFTCGGTCVAEGGMCTTTSDCCAGLPCQIPPGSTQGTCGMNMGCSDYGQACSDTMPCCNQVPCVEGICTGIIL